jgi:hypothetical protein
MASFESPVKLDHSNPKNRVSLMEFGLTWLQKKTVIKETQINKFNMYTKFV